MKEEKAEWLMMLHQNFYIKQKIKLQLHVEKAYQTGKSESKTLTKAQVQGKTDTILIGWKERRDQVEF